MNPKKQENSEPNISGQTIAQSRLESPSGLSWQARVRSLENLLTPAVCRRLGIYAIPDGFLLSVVVPVFNEVGTVEAVIKSIRLTGIPTEIILVNDGSTDGSGAMLDQFAGDDDVIVVHHTENSGKGAAIRTGFSKATGTIVLIQDADLEYSPDDYQLLLQPILEDHADVVYGSRFASGQRPVARFWHQNGNRLITLMSNIFTNLKLTDVETCYKVMRRDVLVRVMPNLQENGFGIELELTAKLAKQPGIRFYECPISYRGRSYAEGKKITWRDAVHAFWCILRY